MRSLRFRLFALIAAATVIVWSVAAVWTTLSAQRDIERVLDRRLREAAHMVASLGSSAVVAPMPNDLPNTTDYERQLSCQVWSLRGQLVGRSSSAPAIPLAQGGAGYSQRMIDGVEWRVYTYIVPGSGLRVMVGDTVMMRRNLVTDLMTGLIVPAVLGLLALAVLIWVATGRGLAPLRRVADAVEARTPDDLSPLAAGAIPRELSVVTDAIDALFERLARLRDTERHFLASAAHELQTPLAGLKTQVQIARRSDDPAIRTNALQRIESSVDRTTRLVRQLLDLARQEGLGHVTASPPLSLARLLIQVQDELAALLARHKATLAMDRSVDGIDLSIDEEILRLALRNLIENAVIYGPTGQTIWVRVDESLGNPRVTIEDEGPGLSQSDAASLRQRFVRGVRQLVPGSGLGLSIVDTALARIETRLRFERRDPHGTRAIIILPHDSACRTASDEMQSTFPKS